MITMAEYDELFEKARSWPPDVRLTLAIELLRTLHPVANQAARQGEFARPASDYDDRLLLHLGRMEKHG